MRTPKGFRFWVIFQLDWKMILATAVLLYLLLRK